MRFQKPKALTSRSVMILTALCAGLSACVSAPPVFQNANKCVELLPESWGENGVESAPLPADKTIGGWMGFAVAQTGQLDKANGLTRDAIQIVKKCEDRNAEAFEALKPKPWYQFW